MRSILLTLAFLLTSTMGWSAYTLQDGKLVSIDPLTTGSVQEHYGQMISAYEAKDWSELEQEALILIKGYPGTPFAKEATYFLGVAYFSQEDFDMANYQFTDYLTRQASPKYFEEAIQYKFDIAEKFRSGARKHLMGFKSMPKWAPSGGEAIGIYDEVISALPHHDLAAHALYGKAEVLKKRDDFRASIEVYQTLIRRFPKHMLSIESYIGIGEIYLMQSQSEYPDPDFLDLAELNLRKFKAAFPGEEKTSLAYRYLVQMQEHYAGSLYEIARFYERTGKWGAAQIYYQKILKSYPDTDTAQESGRRLEYVDAKLVKINNKKK